MSPNLFALVGAIVAFRNAIPVCCLYQAGRLDVRMPTLDGCAVPLSEIPLVDCCRGPSTSLLSFIIIIACRPTHPSFNLQLLQWLLNSRGLWSTAAERHVGAVTDCFSGNA